MHVKDIAKICHAANKAFCEAHGDQTQKRWEDSPEWQRQSAINGVQAHLNSGLTLTPEGSHVSWMLEKEKDGWKYGPVKDAEKKEHPCMVSYHDLPEFQRLKDHLFTAIVHEMAPRI